MAVVLTIVEDGTVSLVGVDGENKNAVADALLDIARQLYNATPEEENQEAAAYEVQPTGENGQTPSGARVPDAQEAAS